MDKTFILNFGHPLAPKVLEAFQPCEEIRIGYNSHPYKDSEKQVRGIVDRAAELIKKKGGALDGTVPLLVVLPGFSEGAVLVVTEVAGRIGSMPRILSLRRGDDGTFGLWSYRDGGKTVKVDYIDLERVKLGARQRRGLDDPVGGQ